MRKASTVLESILWDPCAQKKLPLSICSMPIEHNFGGAQASLRGNLYMLSTIGKLLSLSQGVVKAVIFDGHGTHLQCRKLLHGLSDLDRETVRGLPFFASLKYAPLPGCCLPRLPISITYVNNEVIWGIPGICHWLLF